jgi:hypothetical protein
VQAVAEYRIQIARLERTRAFKPTAIETLPEKSLEDLEEDRA